MGVIQHFERKLMGSLSGLINTRMRILIPLLVLCSFASAYSSTGGYSYETPWLDQNSGWHAPQQIDRSISPFSLLANLFRTNARQAFPDPTLLLGAGGAVANAVYTTTATAGVTD